jgi:hypothetical protein
VFIFSIVQIWNSLCIWDNVIVFRYQDNPGIAVEGRGSVATPGLVAGLKMARDQYGSHQVQYSYRGAWLVATPGLVARLKKARDQYGSHQVQYCYRGAWPHPPWWLGSRWPGISMVHIRYSIAIEGRGWVASQWSIWRTSGVAVKGMAQWPNLIPWLDSKGARDQYGSHHV